MGDKVSKGDLLLSVESSKESPSEKPIPKDTESIIKQAESVLKNEKKEEDHLNKAQLWKKKNKQ